MNDLRDVMTSELLVRVVSETAVAEKNECLNEWQRRISMLELTDEQQKMLYSLEISVIKKGCYIQPEKLLLSESFIANDFAIDVEKCTISELILLTEEADYEYIRNSEELMMERYAWENISRNALNCGICEAALERRKRMHEIGFTYDQEHTYVKNETMIIKRLRWDVNTEEKAW